MQIKTETTFSSKHQKLYQDVLQLTMPVQESYPNYQEWYRNTFLEGLKKGERTILIAEEKGKLLGCALLKNMLTEKKLCTLFVHPDFRGKGIGSLLLKRTIEELGQKPLIAVSEKNRKVVSSLFNRFGFHLSAQKKGQYLPQNTEYYFNDEKAESIQKGLIPVLIQRTKKLQKS